MISEAILFPIIALIISGVYMGLVFYAIKHRFVSGATALAGLLLVAMAYAVTYTMQFTSKNLETSLMWYNISVPVANLIAPSWLNFALSWTDDYKKSPLARNRILSIIIFLFIPTLVCLAAWTNQQHYLYGSDFHLVLQNNLSLLRWVPGLLYWLGYYYAYILFLAGLVTILYRAASRLKLFFQQSIFIIAGALFPVIVNTTYVQGIFSVGYIDITPFSFLVTGIIWGFAIFRLHFVSIVPVAHMHIFKQIPMGIIVLDNSDRVVDINSAALNMMRYKNEAAIGQHLAAKQFNCMLNDFSDNELDNQYKKVCHERGNETYHYNIQKSVLLDQRKNIIGTAFLISDITEQEKTIEALRKSEKRYRSIIQTATDAIIMANSTGEIISWNKGAENIFHYSEEDILGKPLTLLMPDQFIQSHTNSMDYVVNGGEPHLIGKTVEIMAKRKDQTEFPIELVLSKWDDNKEVYFTGIVRDITERKLFEEQLFYQSTHDNLTGLFNRHYYEVEIERLQHSRMFPISIVVMDVDGLKKINDSFGHAAGDELLRQVASLLKKAFRSEDMIARIGGDEFVVILPKTDSGITSTIVKRLKEQLATNNRNPNEDMFEIRISIGQATCPDHNQFLSEFFKKADQCMYEEKEKRKMEYFDE